MIIMSLIKHNELPFTKECKRDFKGKTIIFCNTTKMKITIFFLVPQEKIF